MKAIIFHQIAKITSFFVSKDQVIRLLYQRKAAVGMIPRTVLLGQCCKIKGICRKQSVLRTSGQWQRQLIFSPAPLQLPQQVQ